MNVTIKPPVWRINGDFRFSSVAFPRVEAVVGRHRFGQSCGLFYASIEAAEAGAERALAELGDFATAEEAVLAVERWYTSKVLDCLEPADKATCAEFVTLCAQCNGEYD